MLSMAQVTSVTEIHQLYGESENRLWRLLEHTIEKEVGFQVFSQERAITLAIDGGARRKGRVYLTNFMDLERAKVIHVFDGKGKESILSFKERYEEKEGIADDIETVVTDLSPAFIAGIAEAFPKATIVFDKFHVVKLLNDVLDNIRRREHRENVPSFNKIRYHLLKDPKKLQNNQRERLDDFLTRASLDTVESSDTPNFAYTLIRMFKKGYDYQRPSWAGRFFHQWIKLCQRSKVPEMLKAAQTILTHLKDIMAYFTYRVTNAYLFVFGKLKFDVPKLL